MQHAGLQFGQVYKAIHNMSDFPKQKLKTEKAQSFINELEEKNYDVYIDAKLTYGGKYYQVSPVKKGGIVENNTVLYALPKNYNAKALPENIKELGKKLEKALNHQSFWDELGNLFELMFVGHTTGKGSI